MCTLLSSCAGEIDDSKWIKLDNEDNKLTKIRFSSNNINEFKSKSEEVSIQFIALQNLDADVHSVKFEIDKRRNSNVFFKNGRRIIFRPINYKLIAGDKLKPIRVTFLSDRKLKDIVKLHPFRVKYYFKPDSLPAKYDYEHYFLSTAIE